MADTDPKSIRRRTFIQNSAAATVAATSMMPAASVAQDNNPASPKPLEIPKRMLGKTGVEVTILNGGTARARRPRPAAALRLQPRRPLLRYRRILRDRGGLQEMVRGRAGGPSADLPRHQGWRRAAQRHAQADRSPARGAGDRLHRPALLPRALGKGGRLRADRERDGLAQEQGDEGDDRRHQEDRQGAVRRLRDPRPAPGRAARDRRRGGLDGRGHGRHESVAGEGFSTQPCHRCLSQEEDWSGGDEAGGRPPGEADAGRSPDAQAARAEPLSGDVAGDLVR